MNFAYFLFKENIENKVYFTLCTATEENHSYFSQGNVYLLRQYSINGKKVIHMGDTLQQRTISSSSINSNRSRYQDDADLLCFNLLTELTVFIMSLLIVDGSKCLIFKMKRYKTSLSFPRKTFHCIESNLLRIIGKCLRLFEE